MRVSPEAGNVKGEATDAVTPAGRSDKLTVTVPEKPFCGVSVRTTWALVPAEIVTEEGDALIENEGGAAGGCGPGEGLPPPPQPAVRRLPKRTIQSGTQDLTATDSPDLLSIYHIKVRATQER